MATVAYLQTNVFILIWLIELSLLLSFSVLLSKTAEIFDESIHFVLLLLTNTEQNLRAFKYSTLMLATLPTRRCCVDHTFFARVTLLKFSC